MPALWSEACERSRAYAGCDVELTDARGAARFYTPTAAPPKLDVQLTVDGAVLERQVKAADYVVTVDEPPG